jgi:hypothetical protein
MTIAPGGPPLYAGEMPTSITRAEAKTFLAERFAHFNARFFEGKLPSVPIVFFSRYHDPETKAERYAGYTGDAKLGARLIIITDDALRNGKDFVADSFLHELAADRPAALTAVVSVAATSAKAE